MTALEFPLTDRRDVPDESRAEPALHCSHLVRRFGERTVVDDVSLTIAPGESYGLLGPNGAGKTTIIRMVCGLLRANSGSIRVAGRLVDDNTTSAKSDIGFVPQDVALYPDLSAGENLRFFGRLYGLRGQLLNQRVGDILALIDLTDRGDDRVESFSGGMKRLLNIGAALMPQPSLLVLDEPTVGVDPQAGHAILDSVARIGASGTAVLYTTHSMGEAERVCDRVGIIDRGRLIAEGTRRELVAQQDEHERIEFGDGPRFARPPLLLFAFAAVLLVATSALLRHNGATRANRSPKGPSTPVGDGDAPFNETDGLVAQF